MEDLSGRNWELLLGPVQDRLADIPAGSVMHSVTSPPYWALRSYLDSDDPAKVHELGSEPTIEAFIENLVGVYRDVRRVLHDRGTVAVNLGDSYSGTGYSNHDINGPEWKDKMNGDKRTTRQQDLKRSNAKVKPGNLCLVPHRFAMAMQADGWILRETVVWAKAFSGQFTRGSCMPESLNGTRWERCRVKGGPSRVHREGKCEEGRASGNCTDRQAQWQPCPGCDKCNETDGYVLRRGSWRHTASHEYVFLFAKASGYFADKDAVKEAAEYGFRDTRGDWRGGAYVNQSAIQSNSDANGSGNSVTGKNPDAGRNPRNVLHIGIQAYSEAHFATFPEALPAHYIKAFTPEHGVCGNCFAPWARIVETEQVTRERPNDQTSRHEQGDGVNSCGNTVAGVKSRTLGWRATCDCGAHVIPARVLDPFAGSGTTLRMARLLGRHGIGIELNPKYAELARKRIVASEQPQKKQVESLPGQMSLL